MSGAAQRDVAKLLAGTLLAKLVSTASLMVFTRALTKSEMAVFPAFLMLAGILTLVMTFGIFAAFTRELPGLIRTDMTVARSLVLTASGVIVFGTILPTIAVWVWSAALSRTVFGTDTDAWIVRIMAPGFLAFMISKIVEYVMWGRGQFGATSVVQIIESVVRPVATIAFWLWLGFPGVVIGLVAAQFVMAAIGLWCVRDLAFGPLPPVYPLRKLFSESMSYYAGNYLSFFRGDGDSLLVTLFLGPVALSEYYVAKTLCTNMGLILTAVDKVGAERLARWAGKPEFESKVHDLHRQICRMMIPLCLLAIAVAPGVMIILAGRRYADATLPAIVLLIAILVQFISIPFDRAVYIALPGWIRLKYTTIEAVVAVTAVAILAPLAGLVGVSAARIVAPLGVCAFGALIIHRHLHFALALGPILRSLAIATPGTLIAVFLATPGGNFGEGLAKIAVAASIWVASYLALASIFDRAAIEAIAIEARRRIGMAVSTLSFSKFPRQLS